MEIGASNCMLAWGNSTRRNTASKPKVTGKVASHQKAETVGWSEQLEGPRWQWAAGCPVSVALLKL
jgi:hypothetical protein